MGIEGFVCKQSISLSTALGLEGDHAAESPSAAETLCKPCRWLGMGDALELPGKQAADSREASTGCKRGVCGDAKVQVDDVTAADGEVRVPDASLQPILILTRSAWVVQQKASLRSMEISLGLQELGMSGCPDAEGQARPETAGRPACSKCEPFAEMHRCRLITATHTGGARRCKQAIPPARSLTRARLVPRRASWLSRMLPVLF